MAAIGAAREVGSAAGRNLRARRTVSRGDATPPPAGARSDRRPPRGRPPAARPLDPAAAAPALSPSIVGEAPNGGGVFRFVQAVAFSPGGGLVFTGDQYSGVVQAFGRDGSFRFRVGLRATRREPGRLGVVGGVAVDRSGHLYVLDAENDRVQVFNAADGAYLASFGDASIFDLQAGDPAIGAGISASGLAVDQRTPSAAPTVYVADQGRNRIARFTLDPATLTPAGGPTFSAPELGLLRPQGIALDPAGTLVYVADDQNDRIAVLDPQSLGLVGQIGRQRRRSRAVPGALRRGGRLPPAAAPLRRRQPQQPRRRLRRLQPRLPRPFRRLRAHARPVLDRPRRRWAERRSAGRRGRRRHRQQPRPRARRPTAAWPRRGGSPGAARATSRARAASRSRPAAAIAVADSFNYRVARFDRRRDVRRSARARQHVHRLSERGRRPGPVQPAGRGGVRRRGQHRRSPTPATTASSCSRPTAACCAPRRPGVLADPRPSWPGPRAACSSPTPGTTGS